MRLVALKSLTTVIAPAVNKSPIAVARLWNMTSFGDLLLEAAEWCPSVLFHFDDATSKDQITLLHVPHSGYVLIVSLDVEFTTDSGEYQTLARDALDNLLALTVAGMTVGEHLGDRGFSVNATPQPGFLVTFMDTPEWQSMGGASDEQQWKIIDAALASSPRSPTFRTAVTFPPEANGREGTLCALRTLRALIVGYDKSREHQVQLVLSQILAARETGLELRDLAQQALRDAGHWTEQDHGVEAAEIRTRLIKQERHLAELQVRLAFGFEAYEQCSIIPMAGEIADFGSAVVRELRLPQFRHGVDVLLTRLEKALQNQREIAFASEALLLRESQNAILKASADFTRQTRHAKIAAIGAGLVGGFLTLVSLTTGLASIPSADRRFGLSTSVIAALGIFVLVAVAGGLLAVLIDKKPSGKNKYLVHVSGAVAGSGAVILCLRVFGEIDASTVLLDPAVVIGSLLILVGILGVARGGDFSG